MADFQTIGSLFEPQTDADRILFRAEEYLRRRIESRPTIEDFAALVIIENVRIGHCCSGRYHVTLNHYEPGKNER